MIMQIQTSLCKFENLDSEEKVLVSFDPCDSLFDPLSFSLWFSGKDF